MIIIIVVVLVIISFCLHTYTYTCTHEKELEISKHKMTGTHPIDLSSLYTAFTCQFEFMLKETCFQWRSPARRLALQWAPNFYEFFQGYRLSSAVHSDSSFPKHSSRKLPFLVRFSSSPPLETKFTAAETFEFLPSSTCSSARAIVAVPYPFCNLAFSVAAPLRAALEILWSD